MNVSDDDQLWLLARERSERSGLLLDPVRVAQYERLDALLAALPALDPPVGWEARVLAKLPRDAFAPWKQRWAPALAAGLVAMVGAGAYFASRAGREPTDLPSARSPLSMMVTPGGVANRGGTPAVGDTLEVKFELSEPGELRVYRADGPLVARCPGGAGCGEATVDGRRVLTAKVPVAEVGTYRAVAFTGTVPPPTGQGLNADLIAADRAGAALVSVPQVDVR
jgi:hypothetical protein